MSNNSKAGFPHTTLPMDRSIAPVLMGLGAGTIFLAIVASMSQSQSTKPFGPLDTQRPHNQFGNDAIMIAIQNLTAKEEFKGKELVVEYYRDLGVGYSDGDKEVCPMNHCALIIFGDKTEPDSPQVSVIVNMDSRQVVHILKPQSTSPK